MYILCSKKAYKRRKSAAFYIGAPLSYPSPARSRGGGLFIVMLPRASSSCHSDDRAMRGRRESHWVCDDRGDTLGLMPSV